MRIRTVISDMDGFATDILAVLHAFEVDLLDGGVGAGPPAVAMVDGVCESGSGARVPE